MTERLCVQRMSRCSPGRDHCQCWYESIDANDWNEKFIDSVAQAAVDRVYITSTIKER